MAEQEPTAAAGDDASKQIFRIQRIYLKDVSFESPQSPAIFVNNSGWKPEVALHLNTEKTDVNDGMYEVCLMLTITVKSEKATAYLIEIKQAGLFMIQGFDTTTLGGMLYSFCPNILFPFAREAVAGLVQKGGFPQLLLEPVNFDALYAQHLQSARQNAPAPVTAQ